MLKGYFVYSSLDKIELKLNFRASGVVLVWHTVPSTVLARLGGSHSWWVEVRIILLSSRPAGTAFESWLKF